MGSTGKFLKGKMHNQCERGHTLLSTATQGLNFKRFIEDIITSEEAINNLQQWTKSKKMSCDRNVKNLATQYRKHKE